MPFAASYMDEEEKNKNQAGSGQGVNISGGAGANFATGVPGQDAGGSAKTAKSSGQYANIQSYLDANKDQADQMGSTIASNVTQKADDATSKIQGLEAKAPEIKAYDPNAAYSKLGSLTDDDKNEYRTQKATGGYTGPSSVDQIDGYQDAMKASNEASGLVKNAGNESGQQALLKDTYKRPSYTAGENKLDQALLQNSAGSKQALEGLSSKYAGLSGMFDQVNQKVGDAVNTANATALKNKEGIATAEKGQWDSLMNPIQARANQMNIDNPLISKRVRNDVNDDALSDETLAQLGLGEGQDLYNLVLGSYITPGATQVGVNDVADGAERSRYQALADLVGDSSRNQITSQGMKINPVNFNKDQFNKDVAGRKAEYENYYNSAPIAGVNAQDGSSMTAAQLQQRIDQYKQMAQQDPAHASAYMGSAVEQEKILNKWKQQFNVDRKVTKG